MRLSIFRVRSLLTANVVMLLVASGMFAMFFFNTLYIQRVLGFGPLKAGLAFLPFTAGSSSRPASPRSSRRASAFAGRRDRNGDHDYRHAPARTMPVDGTYLTDVLPALIITSLGMGAVFMPLTLIATTGLEDEDQGLASGLFNTSQQIGGALGLAILSTLAAGRTAAAAARTIRVGARDRLPLGLRRRARRSSPAASS